MAVSQRVRIGRNNPCHCGSGRKYKNCHLEIDLAAERQQRQEAARAAQEEHEERGFPSDLEHYHPLTRKVPAVERQEFRVLVQRLSQTGTSMLVHTPQDLAREQAGLDEALRFCAERHVPIEFDHDPPLGMIAGLQSLIDGMYGRGVYLVRQTGVRLHRYGRSRQIDEDVVSVFYVALPSRAAARLVLAESAEAEAQAQGIPDSPLRHRMACARVLRHLTIHYLDLPEWARNNISMLLEVMIDEISDAAEVEGEALLGPSSEASTVYASLPFALALPEAVDAPATALEGVGLDADAAALIVPHLEHIRDTLPWVRRAGALAPEGWETPEGYEAWKDALTGITELDVFMQLVAEWEARTANEFSAGEEQPEPVDLGRADGMNTLAAGLAATTSSEALTGS